MNRSPVGPVVSRQRSEDHLSLPLRRVPAGEVPRRHRSVIRLAPLALIVLAGAVACGDEVPDEQVDYGNVVAFDTTRLRLVGKGSATEIGAELAVSTEQKTMGLMERRQLPENAGMLFVYDSVQSPESGFWMYRTRIPLDIAFLDSAGVIRAIHPMVPCETTLPQGCPAYAAGVPYRYALEVNRGFFARHGLAVGDSVAVTDALRARPAPRD